jgi:phytoene dehydrogenase-like protein
LPYVKGLKMFDQMKYGELAWEMPLVVCQTMLDPTRAPKGKHTLYLYHYAPYDLADGGPQKWDEIREEVADKVLGTLRKQTTNMGNENIIGRAIQTPLDLERRNISNTRGDLTHFGMFFDQTMGNRPLPGWGDGRTPINKLWMCGASCHPGLGIHGGGRAQVQPLMAELGIDFEKVISK